MTCFSTEFEDIAMEGREAGVRQVGTSFDGAPERPRPWRLPLAGTGELSECMDQGAEPTDSQSARARSEGRFDATPYYVVTLTFSQIPPGLGRSPSPGPGTGWDHRTSISRRPLTTGGETGLADMSFCTAHWAGCSPRSSAPSAERKLAAAVPDGPPQGVESCLGFKALENAVAPPEMIHRHWGTPPAWRPRFRSWRRRRVAAHAAVCRRCVDGALR